MERTIPARELSRAEFARADRADDEEIRALLRGVPMNGSLQIGFAREPSFFARHAPTGDVENTLVARRNGQLLSVGSWLEREVWLEGARKIVGYLHGLRMAPGTVGALRVLRDGYRCLAAEIAASQACGWFTSVAADNTHARRLLENRASGLPRYQRIAEYLTRVIPVPRRGSMISGCGMHCREELTAFLNREGVRRDLAMTWDGDRWEALARAGFTPENIVVVRRGERIVAAAGLWDQTAWRQVIIHRYPGWVQWLRPLIDIGTASLGGPSLPTAGRAISLAPVFPFAVEEKQEAVLPELWGSLLGMARNQGLGWLALGLDASDPIGRSIRCFGVSYRTILYWVCGRGFPEQPPEGCKSIIRPDCATL